MEIPPKPINIDILVFLKVDIYDMNLLQAFRNKIRYFGATFGIFLGKSWAIFGHFLVKSLVLHTFWTIITLDLVCVSLSRRKI